ANLFKKIVTELKADAIAASVALIQYPKRLKKKHLNPDNISEEDIYEIFRKYKSGEIAREGILILMEAAATGNKNFDEVIGKPLNENDMAKVFEETEYELNHKRISKSAMIREVILGESMEKVRGRYAGSKASQLLNQKMELKNV
ncbi:MAG TPA: hypothetical protein PK447_06705, partial [Ignavibacteria bacterium]|nr:hypothetical protein [Ignavibacteria bacterium]